MIWKLSREGRVILIPKQRAFRLCTAMWIWSRRPTGQRLPSSLVPGQKEPAWWISSSQHPGLLFHSNLTKWHRHSYGFMNLCLRERASGKPFKSIFECFSLMLCFSTGSHNIHNEFTTERPLIQNTSEVLRLHGNKLTPTLCLLMPLKRLFCFKPITLILKINCPESKLKVF